MRQNKKVEKELEGLNLAPLDATAFIAENANGISAVPPTSYKAEEGEEELEILGLEEEDSERIETDQALEDEIIFHPQDITWEYLKGLEKISLLTPEKEVELVAAIVRSR